jgi:hypothetical protein
MHGQWLQLGKILRSSRGNPVRCVCSIYARYAMLRTAATYQSALDSARDAFALLPAAAEANEVGAIMVVEGAVAVVVLVRVVVVLFCE